MKILHNNRPLRFAILFKVITLLAQGRSANASEDPCVNPLRIGNIRRTTTEDPGTCGGICDNNIDERYWYRLDASNSGARMPESCVPVWHCGTYIPIWLKTPHPAAPSNEPIVGTVCAQLRVDGPCCEWTSEISVKGCTMDAVDYYVYKLKTPPYCDMAYCAGSGVNCGDGASWNDVRGNCTRPQFPSIDSNPTLEPPYISESKQVIDISGRPFTATRFSIKCKLTHARLSVDDGGRYDVIFEADGKNIFSTTLTSVDAPEVVLKESYFAGHINQRLTCKVTSYWKSQFPTRSPFKTSAPITLTLTLKDVNGVDVDRISIVNGNTVTVTAQASFPITTPWCLDQPAEYRCSPFTSFRIYSTVIRLSACTFQIPSKSQTSNKISVSNNKDAPQHSSGSLSFTSDNAYLEQESVFKGFTSKQYPVSVIDSRGYVLCESTGDPHFKAFYRHDYTFHSYLDGVFTLVSVPSKKLEVQVRQVKCGAAASCNCGIIAREGNNMFAINYCDSNPLPKIARYLTDSSNPGGYIEEGNRWTIHLPSGMSIEVGVDGTFIHIFELRGFDDDLTTYGGYCSYNPPGDQTYCSNCEIYRVQDPKNNFFRFNDNFKPDCYGSDTPIVPSCNCPVSGPREGYCGSPNKFYTLKTCSSAPSKRKRQDSPPSGTDNSANANNITFDANAGRTEPVLDWPTPRNRITKDMATDACRSAARNSQAYDLCVGQLQVNISSKVAQCVLDIQLMDDIVTPPTIVASQMEVLCNNVIQNLNDSSLKQKYEQQYSDNVCPNHCNQRGSCLNGSCQCKEGNMGRDCSLTQGQVPEVKAIRPPLCDIRYKSCSSVYLTASFVSTDQTTCRFTNVTGQLIVIDKSPTVQLDTVICDVPVLPVKDHLSNEFIKCNYSVWVSLSNDGQKFSSEHTLTIYNGNYTTCTAEGVCTPLPNAKCSADDRIKAATLMLFVAYLFCKMIN